MSILEMKRCLDEALPHDQDGERRRVTRDRFQEDHANPGRCSMYGAYSGAFCSACTRYRDGLCDGGLQEEDR